MLAEGLMLKTLIVPVCSRTNSWLLFRGSATMPSGWLKAKRGKATSAEHSISCCPLAETTVEKRRMQTKKQRPFGVLNLKTKKLLTNTLLVSIYRVC